VETFKPFFNFGISLAVHSVKVVMATTTTPRYTSWVIYLLLDVKDGTDVVNLKLVSETTPCHNEGGTYIPLGDSCVDSTDKRFE